MPDTILVVVEQREGKLNRVSWETIAAGQAIAAATGWTLEAAVVGGSAASIAAEVAAKKVAKTYALESPKLEPYTPDAFAEALKQFLTAKQPKLVGNWIPQVARNMATAQVAFSHRRLGLLSVQGRYSGRQYDDDANQFLLHSYFRLGAYASHDFGRHLVAFAAGDNLYDRSIEAGKTPTLTLASPRVVRFGVRINFGE